jgi:hypothetical protein
MRRLNESSHLVAILDCAPCEPIAVGVAETPASPFTDEDTDDQNAPSCMT